MTTLLYEFDGNLHDSTGYASGIAQGVPPSATFTGQSIIGQGYYFTSFYFQYMSIPYVNLSRQSFTFQTWIIPYNDNGTELGIFSQCGSVDNICFGLSIRSQHVVWSLDADNPNDVPLISSTILPYNIWSHITIVYDAIALQQLMYTNGRVDAVSIGMVMPYQGTPAGQTTTAIGLSLFYGHSPAYLYG